jgi:hypothetical protein
MAEINVIFVELCIIMDTFFASIKRGKKSCKHVNENLDISFSTNDASGFNDTFNNISVISWRSVLLVEETRVPGEKDRPDASH